VRNIKTYLTLPLLFLSAFGLILVLGIPRPAGATEAASGLFSSPITNNDDHNSDHRPPSAAEKGEVDPVQGDPNQPIGDPDTPGLVVFFPWGSAHEPLKIRFFNSGLPQNIAPPSNVSGATSPTVMPNGMNTPYFFFGAWRTLGLGGAVYQFDHSIMIQAPYQAGGLNLTQESQLRLWMYDPTIRSWIKLGGRVDIFNNIVTGLISSLTPFEPGGNTLFVLFIDDSPPVQQTVDEFGATTLWLSDRDDFRFHVLPGTVEAGSHFEVMSLPYIPESDTFQLLTRPIGLKAYFIDRQNPAGTDDYQITEFSKPVSIEFDYTPEMLAGAGDPSNLTIVTLRNGQWVDVETLGYQVSRTGDKITVDTSELGIFSVAIKS
jgi:hypothetical protein